MIDAFLTLLTVDLAALPAWLTRALSPTLINENPGAPSRAHGAKGLTKNVLILRTGGWQQPA
jgi:hypothetical protein